MRHVLRIIGFAAVLVALGTAPSQAQDASGPAVLKVRTNAPNALVYAEMPDSVVTLGPALMPLRLPLDATAIRIVAFGGDGWQVEPIRFVVDEPMASDTLEIAADFPYRYRIESVPYGATVRLRSGRILGITPLTVEFDEPLSTALTLQRGEYRSAEIASPGSALWNRHVIALEPNTEVASSGITTIGLDPPRRRRWIDALALTTAVAGGVVAVHYKFKADRRFDEYDRTGDPAIRDEINGYDTASAVGLGVMQAGVGLFAIRLVLR